MTTKEIENMKAAIKDAINTAIGKLSRGAEGQEPLDIDASQHAFLKDCVADETARIMASFGTK